MKNYQRKTKGEIAKCFLAAVLVLAAVVGVSALPMDTATHNRNSLARSLKSIQTDQAIHFQANIGPAYATRFVERVPAMTGESRTLTENLKLAAATL
jgi:hypothetical protein